MSDTNTPHQPSVGPTSLAPNTVDDLTGPWSYNDLLRIVSHETPSCDICAEWAEHYLKAALRKDRSLCDAEVQRSAVLNAPLMAELDTTRAKLSSADAEILRLSELNKNNDRDADEVIRDLKERIRDLERGSTPRRRKV